MKITISDFKRAALCPKFIYLYSIDLKKNSNAPRKWHSQLLLSSFRHLLVIFPRTKIINTWHSFNCLLFYINCNCDILCSHRKEEITSDWVENDVAILSRTPASISQTDLAKLLFERNPLSRSFLQKHESNTLKPFTI